MAEISDGSKACHLPLMEYFPSEIWSPYRFHSRPARASTVAMSAKSYGSHVKELPSAMTTCPAEVHGLMQTP